MCALVYMCKDTQIHVRAHTHPQHHNADIIYKHHHHEEHHLTACGV